MSVFIYFILAIILAIADQFVKYWVVANLELGQQTALLPNILSLYHIRNTGAAWSIFEGKMWFFTIISVVAIAVLSYLLVKYYRNGRIFSLGIALILGGTLGNFIDRIRLGYVVDMFKTDFIQFPIFNLADVELTIGVIFIFIYILFEERLKK